MYLMNIIKRKSNGNGLVYLTKEKDGESGSIFSRHSKVVQKAYLMKNKNYRPLVTLDKDTSMVG